MKMPLLRLTLPSHFTHTLQRRTKQPILRSLTVHPLQVGGECVVQWYGDHRVDTVKHSVLTTFPIVPPRAPARRSVRGRNALEKAIAEALKNTTTDLQDYQELQQRSKNNNIESPVGVTAAEDTSLNGLGGRLKNRTSSKVAKPALKCQDMNISLIYQETLGEANRKNINKVKTLPVNASLAPRESPLSPPHLLLPTSPPLAPPPTTTTPTAVVAATRSSPRRRVR